jgi:hypothetical protein
MGRPNAILRDWLKVATPADARLLAAGAKTSVPNLRHVAKGRRGMTPAFAQRLAHASRAFPLLLRLSQTELCKVCAQCPLVMVARRPK